MDHDVLFDAETDGTRRCGRCGVVRPLAMFYLDAERRRGASRGSGPVKQMCRVCRREANQAFLGPRYEIVARIKTEAGCADCGIQASDHPEIYDFDHRPGTGKVTNVAKLLTKGTLEDLLAEIAKCDVVCANCHRIRTHRREPNAFGRDRPGKTTHA